MNAYYKIYLACFEQYKAGRISFSAARRGYEEVLKWMGDDVRVTGITINALKAFAEVDFARSPSNAGLERAHLVSRAHHSRIALGGDSPISEEEFVYRFVHAPAIVVKGKAENAAIEQQRLVVIPTKDGDFRNGGTTVTATAEGLLRLREAHKHLIKTRTRQ